MPGTADNVSSMVKYQVRALNGEQVEIAARLQQFLELERQEKVRSAGNMPIPLFQAETRPTQARRLRTV
jgi:hypothetical protein